MEYDQDNKIKWFGIASIWFGGIVSVPALLIGSALISSLPFSTALLAGFIGFVFVVFFMSLLSIAAVDRQKAIVPLASSSFGHLGANVVVGLVIGLSTLGWFAVQSNIAGASFSKIVMEMSGQDIPAWASSIFWGIIMVLTAVFGFKYLKWLNYIAVPSIIILLAYGLYVTFQTHSFQEVLDFRPSGENGLSLLAAIGLSIGFISVGGVISPDYNRFAASKKHAIWGSIMGIIPSALSLLAIGAILAVTQGTYDIVEIFASLGFPFFAMSILILATWTSNVMNVYSSGLAFTNLFQLPESKRSMVTLMVGLIGVLLAAAGLIDHFMEFITLLTITVTPVAGVVISDYFLSKSFTEESIRFNWKGIVSWGLGVTIMLLMTHEIKYVLGILGSAIFYWLFEKFIPQKSNL
ncbi:MAG: cytosine permease [Maribacter sp.]|jgi:cytosine permease